MSGLFVFEGTDGAGKSNIMQSVAEKLEDRTDKEIVTTYEPGGPPGRKLGDQIRSMLLDPDNTIGGRAELFLFLADRADHLEKFIIPGLKEEKVILTDRYWESSLVYQAIIQEVVAPSELYSLHEKIELPRPTKAFVITSAEPHYLNNDRIDKKMISHRKRMNNIYNNIDTFPFIEYPVIKIDTTDERWQHYHELITKEIINTIGEKKKKVVNN